MKTRALACPGWKMFITCGWLVVDYSGSVRPGPTVDGGEDFWLFFSLCPFDDPKSDKFIPRFSYGKKYPRQEKCEPWWSSGPSLVFYFCS